MKLCCQVCIFFITVINGNSSPEFQVVILPRFIKSVQQELRIHVCMQVRRPPADPFP